MSTAERRKAACSYIKRGVMVIPVRKGEKNPGIPDWQDLQLTVEEVPYYWTNGQNIGALNGAPSGWRVCVDLDVPEALTLLIQFTPSPSTLRPRAS